MGASCETSGGGCATHESECCEKESACGSSAKGGCGQGGDCGDIAVAKWSSAFCEAMHEVHVELLKERIQKAWGAKMGKAADAVVEAMGVHWQSMLAQGHAKAELKDQLRRLMQEGKK